MTQPTQIYFGPDQPNLNEDSPCPKIYLRTLLFSTSKRGRVIENMYVAVTRDETRQNFNIWVHRENGKLVRGSGLFVGEIGVTVDHHFLTPSDASSFRFDAGQYRVEVFAHLVGDKNRIMLFSQPLEVTQEDATKLKNRDMGLYFDWGPDASRYVSHVRKLGFDEGALIRSILDSA